MPSAIVNGDEEISSPGSRSTISRVASTQDAVFSFEGGGSDGGVRLAMSGIGSAYLTVEGRSSHAGARPEGGIDALYEFARQVRKARSSRVSDSAASARIRTTPSACVSKRSRRGSISPRGSSWTSRRTR